MKYHSSLGREGGVGNDDLFAEDLRPRVEKVQVGVAETLEGVTGSISGITTGTTHGVKNISGTQADNVSVIHASARGAKRAGRQMA